MGGLEAAVEAIPRLNYVVGAVCKKNSMFLHSGRIRTPTGNYKNAKRYIMNGFMTYCGTLPDTKRR
jgi:hypothetical protein